MECKRVFGVVSCGMLALAAWGGGPTATEMPEDTPGTQVFELGEMLVVAGRTVGEDATSSVLELDADDIRIMGAKHAADILHHLPGSFVRLGNEGDAMARVRGYRQREVKVVVDGVPMTNPYTGRQDLQKIPASNIAKVRLIRGGGSVLYGPNAMGGVVEIITSKAGDEPAGAISVEAGDDAYWRSALSLGMPWKSFYANLALDATDRDGFPLARSLDSTALENGNTSENSGLKHRSGTLKLGWESEDTRVGLTITQQASAYGMAFDITGAKTKFERVEDMDRLHIAAIAEHAFSERTGGKLSLFHTGTDVLRSAYDDQTFSTQANKGALTEEAQDDVTGGAVLLNTWISRFADLSLSYGLEQSRRDADGFEINKSNVSVPFEITERTWVQYLALEDRMDLAESLSGSLGVRVDSWHAESRDETYSWNIGATWTPLAWLSVTPAVYRRSRFPFLRELYEAGRGNPDLKPAMLTGTSLDIALTPWESWQFRAALFHEDIDDLIDRDGSNVYQNIDEARHRGFEVGCTKDITEVLSLSVDYSYLDAEDRSGDVDNTRLRYRPRHKIDTRITYTPSSGLELAVGHTFLGEQCTSENTNDTIRSSSVLDVAVSQRINEHARIFGRANNLFDDSYYTSDNIAAAGRALLAGIELTF
jgi:outer membrane cobalamin receptor